MSPEVMEIGILGGTAGLSALLGAWLFRKGSGLEKVKKECLEIADVAAREGYEIIPEILRNVAVNDISGAIDEIRAGIKLIRDPEKRQAHFDKIRLEQLKNALADPRRSARFVEIYREHELTATAKAKVAAATKELKPEIVVTEVK